MIKQTPATLARRDACNLMDGRLGSKDLRILSPAILYLLLVIEARIRWTQASKNMYEFGLRIGGYTFLYTCEKGWCKERTMTANGITMRHTISRNPELITSNRLLPPASTSVVVVAPLFTTFVRYAEWWSLLSIGCLNMSLSEWMHSALSFSLIFKGRIWERRYLNSRWGSIHPDHFPWNQEMIMIDRSLTRHAWSRFRVPAFQVI